MIGGRRTAATTTIGTGELFAGYVLEERLGEESSTGVVYRARDERLGRRVALRLIAPEVAGDPVTRARLNRETTALASVDHANVLPIYEAGERDGRLFIVNRWVDGGNLSDLVRRDGTLEPRRAIRIANQVAAALQATHALGIMHRNVKPTSVLLTSNDHAYLTDFGLARHAQDEVGLTVEHHLLATFDYVPPEYIEGRDVDRRVDIYGLGCVLYFALTGEVPFPKAGAAAKMYAHLSAERPSVRAARPELPESLDAAIRRAMAADPDARQQTVGEFAAEVSGALDLTVPPWVLLDDAKANANANTNGNRNGNGNGEGDARAPVARRGAQRHGRVSDDFFEPRYYLNRPRRMAVRAVMAACLLLFIAVPVVLLIVLLHA